MSGNDQDIYGIRPENLRDVADRSVATATAFNPFDALGVSATAMTDAEITAAWRRAHYHLIRAVAPPLFPLAAEINAARDFLREATASRAAMATAVRQWAGHPRTFFAERNIGGPLVFNATAATAAAGSAPLPASGGSRAQPSSRRRAATSPADQARAPKSARANATPSTPGASRANPYAVDSDDEEDDEYKEDGLENITPMSTATADTDTTGTPTSAARKPANRSGGGSARAAVAVQPDTSLEIVVGEWRQSTATPRNAVIARLDARGRLNFRVVARTLAGVPIAGPTATATSYPNIILSGNYIGMNYNVLRTTLILQLSRHQQQLGN